MFFSYHYIDFVCFLVSTFFFFCCCFSFDIKYLTYHLKKKQEKKRVTFKVEKKM